MQFIGEIAKFMFIINSKVEKIDAAKISIKKVYEKYIYEG
jgi:predicted nuclease of restriction endonuclease-like (RecB) superfamily